MEVSGDLRFGEAGPVLPFAQARLLGEPLGHLVQFVPMIGMGAVGALAHQAECRWPIATEYVFAYWMVATSLVLFLYGWWLRRVIRAAWVSRGLTDPSVTTCRVAEQGLVIESLTGAVTMSWRAVTEMSRLGSTWVIFGLGGAYVLPRRLFSNSAEEAAFLAECRGRLTPEAIGRSVGLADIG